VFLQACLNGSRPPGDHERLPLTPAELARDAAEVAEAGAVSVHVHPRGPDGLESLEPEHCGAAVRALREAAELEISLSTGLWITDGDVEHRLECVRGWTELPDCVSVNVIEEGWEDLVALLHERGIGIEIGLWRAEHPGQLAAAGLARRCRRALVEPQETAPAIAVATAGAIDGGLEREHIGLTQLHHGYDHTTWAVLDAAVGRDREIRIGFEDSYRLPAARRADSNAELVAAAVDRYISSSG
jgi:uncharacterized protein (DUF849 family)